ncbi:MAG: hypothetical protein JNN11_03455 [Candidatus Doudnabacteria bacterium]|nr:hypothetical protein [Candidatus Doudnabacteria bacterium]
MPDNPEPSNNKKLYTKIGIFALSSIILFTVIYFFLIRDTTPTKNDNMSATDIQNLFSPPTPFLPQTSTQTPPSPFTPTHSTGPEKLDARGLTPQNLNSPTPSNQTYINQVLGFKINLHGQWEQSVGSDNSIFLNDEQNRIINIQSYPAPPEGIGLIKHQLENSPSIQKTNETSFSELPAISFLTQAQNQGIAFIKNNTLFYIFGVNYLEINSFSFLQ